MTAASRPIPALYTVYVLRSTVRHASLYIGSTPNPPRRLKQHNGEIKGGAARTSRKSLRPWEMVALVSGFPSMVAALKFEWALTNPHLSLHIPTEARISRSAGVKGNGHPKRPRAAMGSIMSNLHLLLRVPSFARWPLQLHLLAKPAWEHWASSCREADSSLPDTFRISTDFDADDGGQKDGKKKKKEKKAAATATAAEPEMELLTTQPRGIHALPLDYSPMTDYAKKGRSIITFEREGNCIVCEGTIEPGEGLHVICSNPGCEGVGHISCWSRHLLTEESDGLDEAIIPVAGQCPSCGGNVWWEDLMKELTLRERGVKEVDKLLKARKKGAASGGLPK